MTAKAKPEEAAPPLSELTSLTLACTTLSDDLDVLARKLRNHVVSDASTAMVLQRACMLVIRDASQVALSLRSSINQLPLPKVQR